MKLTPFAVFTAALLLLALPATGALDLDKIGGGLGDKIEFQFTGDANEAFLLFPSLLGGPTPLSILDPTDPRSLQVGLDMLYLITFGSLNSAGKGLITFPLPTESALHGLRLHWQAITAPGSTYTVDDISNKVVASLGVKSCFIKLPGKMIFDVALPGAAPLSGNRALICGGAQGNLTSGNGLKSAAIYHGLTQTWTKAPDMAAPRLLGVTVKLNDGRVLVCGGADSAGNVTRSTEIFDPVQNKWTAVGNMTTPRVGHAGVLLGNGTVLVSGGVQTLADPLKAITGAHKSAEIFNPKTGLWTSTGNMKKVRIAHTLTVTGNRVVATAGLSFTMLIIIPLPEFTKTAEYYQNGSWRSTGAIKNGRAAHSAIAMKDGKVLVCGGVFSSNILDLNSYKAIANAELYNPTTNTWTTLPSLKSARALPSMILRPDGKVLICGGAQGTYQTPVALKSCEIFTANTFALHTYSLDISRVGMGVVQLDDGSLLFAAGAGGSANSSLDTALILFP